MLRYLIHIRPLAFSVLLASLLASSAWAHRWQEPGQGEPATASAAESQANETGPGGQQPGAAGDAESKEAESKEAESKEAEHKEAEQKQDPEHKEQDAQHKEAAAAGAGHDSEGGHAAAGAHGGGHHDPHDLSHQNASHAIEDPSQWKSDLAIASFIVFLCLLALLSKFAWRPVMDGLEARERGIAAKIEEAKRSADQAAEQLRQYEAKLAAASEEARVMVDQARRDAESAKERILAEAQVVAERERQRAVEDINTAKNVALQEMTQKSVDLAVAMAGRLIRQKLKPEDHAQLIREMVDQFPSRN